MCNRFYHLLYSITKEVNIFINVITTVILSWEEGMNECLMTPQHEDRSDIKRQTKVKR